MTRRARERAISALHRTARRLGPTRGLRDQGALPFDGFEDQLFIGEGEAPIGPGNFTPSLSQNRT